MCQAQDVTTPYSLNDRLIYNFFIITAIYVCSIRLSSFAKHYYFGVPVVFAPHKGLLGPPLILGVCCEVQCTWHTVPSTK